MLIDTLNKYANPYFPANSSRSSALYTFSIILRNKGLIAIIYHLFERFVYKNNLIAPFKSTLKIINIPLKMIMLIITKIDISYDTQMDPGVYLSNKGRIIIGAISLGDNCRISSNVTIGMDLNGLKPTIGNSVTISENVVIYGDINVGDSVNILPGTILNRSVPQNKTIQGNPARLIK